MGRKESVRERDILVGENCEIFSIAPLFSSIFLRMADVAPDVGFRRSWYRWKDCDTIFLKVPDLREGELGFVRCGPAK